MMAAAMAMEPSITAALPLAFAGAAGLLSEGDSQSSQHNAAQRRKQQAHHTQNQPAGSVPHLLSI